MLETMLLLHGFSGTRRTWDGVTSELSERYRPLALDLPGHGEAAGVRPADLATCTDWVLDGAPDRFALVGYSMGGRIALHVALAAPGRVSLLGLISATAGIESASERAERRAADEELAASIERDGVEAFATLWATRPLFAGQSPGVAAAAHADRLRNDAAGLAACVRGAGTGAMEPQWHRLGELRMPAVVIAGERDRKFCALGERLADALPHATLHVVRGAGHAVHLEAPGAVARILQG